MSKLSPDTVREAVKSILKHSEEKKRNFTESIELQIALKNYDAARDKRISGNVKLPEVPKARVKICILGDAKACKDAAEAGFDYMSEDDLKKLNRNKKLVKKLASRYEGFLASASLIKKIPRLLGPGLSKAGKFPQVLPASADVKESVRDISSTVRFNLRIKVGAPMCMAAAVANVSMTEDDIVNNILIAINYVVSLLKKKWQNVKRLYLKSTMGPAFRIFGY